MTVKPYLQLVRLPNVFTAAADSLAGWLLVEGTFRGAGHWAPLVLASACVYAGGIVLNDVFDHEVDRVERPGRPIPSGRVGLRTAAALGLAFLAAGLALAFAARTRQGGTVAAALIGVVLAYDAGLKRTPLGPEAMGACRGLNLLLGMSQAPALGGPVAWLVAGSYAGFVTGITWVSRSEVHTGRRSPIAAGVALQNAAFYGLLAACVLAGRFPQTNRSGTATIVAGAVVLMGVAVVVNGRTARALRDPVPAVIQRAVKTAIFSLVWLHVGVVLAVRGPLPAAAVALFWIPATYAGRWIYST